MDQAASDVLAKQILDWIAIGTAPTGTDRYLALAVTRPTMGGSFTEVSGASYARVNLSGEFTAVTLGARVLANDSVITFPTAGGAWTAARYWVVMTASSGGDVLACGEIYPAVTLAASGVISFDVGEIVLRVP